MKRKPIKQVAKPHRILLQAIVNALNVIFNEDKYADKVIESELIKVNQSIDRKWAILDDFSASWTWTQWKNFKDSLYGEISYREYLIILQSELK